MPALVALLAALSGLTSVSILAESVIAIDGPGTPPSASTRDRSNPHMGAPNTFDLVAARASGSFVLAMNQSQGETVARRAEINPGDTTSFSTSVRVKRTADYVVLHVKKPVATTCRQNRLHCPRGAGKGNLARALRLTIIDTTTDLGIYRGSLFRLPHAASYRIICAKGSVANRGLRCQRRWAANERHHFTFTVSFPLTGHHDNAYQGTGVKIRFVWMRN